MCFDETNGSTPPPAAFSPSGAFRFSPPCEQFAGGSALRLSCALPKLDRWPNDGAENVLLLQKPDSSNVGNVVLFRPAEQAKEGGGARDEWPNVYEGCFSSGFWIDCKRQGGKQIH